MCRPFLDVRSARCRLEMLALRVAMDAQTGSLAAQKRSKRVVRGTTQELRAARAIVRLNVRVAWTVTSIQMIRSPRNAFWKSGNQLNIGLLHARRLQTFHHNSGVKTIQTSLHFELSGSASEGMSG